VLLPAQVVHVLGGPADLLEAALAEPAAVAWRAIGRGRPRPGERIAVVGDGTLADVKAAFPVDDAVNNDLLISASFAYTSAAFAEVAALLSAGQISPGPLITHRFPLEAYEQAYKMLQAGSGPRGKVILDVSAP
jgi:threonine dehydrogenase-like Zn-dependent dehydrogenase